MELIALALCALLGGVMVISAVSKFMAPHDFVQSVANYPGMRDPVLGVVALGVPWVEVAVGSALLTGVGLRTSAFSAIALLSVFSLAMGAAMARGKTGKCGCGSRGLPSEIGWEAVTRNVVLIAVASVIAIIGDRPLALASVSLDAAVDDPIPVAFALSVVVLLFAIEAIVLARRTPDIQLMGATLEEGKEPPWSSEIAFADVHS